MASLIIDWIGGSATIPYKALVLIPQDYDHLTLVAGSAPNGSYELDTLSFWGDLKTLEEAESGIVFDDLQTHNLPYTIAGTVYADAIAMKCEVAFYNSVPNEEWTVILLGSNNDLFDVVSGVYVPDKGTGDVNLVSTNSAGLVITGTSGLTAAESAALLQIEADVALLLSAQDLTNEQQSAEHITSRTLGKVILRNTTTLERWEADAWEDEAKTIPYGTNQNIGIEAVGMLVSVAWS